MFKNLQSDEALMLSSNVKTYNIMINGLCKEGLFEEALSLLLEMEDNDCLSNAVTIETVIHTLFEKIRMT
ncbi:hypothetical protein Ahy_B05g075390 [Arachis hypogaea]|uniref:Pentatricopeptide repeat-containing protein n=1 Tax=Arachis hypogaea TaxID=3818 RepID=A0A444Z131_ARAHY|nr:hypothetical protein Ahy_B05g075390 [Arachis hypogaea]